MHEYKEILEVIYELSKTPEGIVIYLAFIGQYLMIRWYIKLYNELENNGFGVSITRPYWNKQIVFLEIEDKDAQYVVNWLLPIIAGMILMGQYL